jgi:hypothetical protein
MRKFLAHGNCFSCFSFLLLHSFVFIEKETESDLSFLSGGARRRALPKRKNTKSFHKN